MSTFTENYQLHQWVPEDNFLRADFNEDNAKIDAALATIPKIALGTYTGTRTYGSESPNSLSFDFKPSILLIFCPSETHAHAICLPGEDGNAYAFGQSDSQYLNHVTWSGNTVSWYCTSSYNGQFNRDGKTYYYLAI